MAKRVVVYDADGATVLTNKTLATLLAGATGTAQKFGVKNVGDQDLGGALVAQALISQVDTGDGWTRLRIKKDTATLSPPWGFSAAVGAGSGTWGAPGTRGYVIISRNATGDTIASTEVTAPITVLTQQVTLTWTQVTGATGYRIYRTDTPGTYSGNNLLTTIGSGATVTFLDTGAATGAGSVPTTNTTGGAGPAYGTPPATLDTTTTPVSLGQTAGTLAVGETSFFWINRVVPANSAEAGNPRQVRIKFVET